LTSNFSLKHYLRIGSIVCNISSNTSRYASMLAEAYSTHLIDRGTSEENNPEVVLRFFIREDPCSKLSEKDTIVVSSTKNGFKIETDPISCYLEINSRSTEDNEAVADFIVHQPELETNLLAYHLYLITNRILLLLDALLVHAAAIELNGVVNLFCGHKGAGKSTLSLFLAQAGAHILAEDRIVLRQREKDFLVSGCSSKMKIMSKTEQFLIPNQLDIEASLISGIPKKVFNAEQFFSAIPHVDRKPARLFLNQVGNSFKLKQISANEALLKMVDRTGNMYRFGCHQDYSSFFNFITSFINQVECYSLDLSANLNDLPLLLEALNELDKISTPKT
jgi:hypothetical protein